MSRRPPNPNAERAAQNQQTLKTLVKIESNKSCADCKRNKHPRWASWSLGVFLCIRCSGIHRGMGTHISRVKSVDLDAWTDDQVQNMIRWGNARANKYWEAKLAAGHVPAEAKIENFIRTKYDSKRWAMDGPMPDPATLDVDEDEDVPLTVVQEKAKMNTSHQRVPSASTSSQPPPQTQRANPDIDLFGDSHEAPVAQRTAKPPPTPPKTNAPASKPSKPGESLLGFDFFGDTQAPPPRPSSAAASISSSTAPSRPDLKQSILSLYASAPKPAGGPAPSTGTAAVKGATQQPSFGSLESDFRSLNFGSASPGLAQVGMSSPRSSSAAPSVKSPQQPSSITSGGSDGGFFDSIPSPPMSTSSATTHPPAPQRGLSSSSGFGDFTSSTSPGVSAATAKTSSNGLSDLLSGFGSTSPPATKPTPLAEPVQSPFNLSKPPLPPPTTTTTTTTTPSVPPPKPTPPPVQTSAAIMSDPWGSNEAWASSANPTNPTTSQQPSYKAPAPVSASEDWGWSDTGKSAAKPPQITAEDDFGGWESSTVASPTKTNVSQPPPKPMTTSFSTNTDDLFSNVWE